MSPTGPRNLGTRRIQRLINALEDPAIWAKPAKELIITCMDILNEANEGESDLPESVIYESLRYATTARDDEQNREVFRGIFRDILVRGQAQGEVRPDVVPERVAEMIEAMYFHAILKWLGSGKTLSLSADLREKVEILYGGLRPN